MAIKGKKKPQRRGSQGARRPASAPRPAPVARSRRTPWYRTRDGMLILGVFLVVLAGLGIWLIVSAQERAAEARERRDAIEAYTSSVQSRLQGITETVTEMNLVATPPSGESLEELASDTEGWVESLRAAQTEIVELFPEQGLEPVNELFNETLSLYISAAQTFALVPEVGGETREQLFARAADQRDTASTLWASAIGVLDQMRRDQGLPASGMRAPEPAAQAPGMGTDLDELPFDPEELEGEFEIPEEETGEGADENDDGSTEEDGGG